MSTENNYVPEFLAGDAARLKLRDGIEYVVSKVSVTYGAAGKNVVFTDDYGRKLSTKDGFTVAKHTNPEDVSLQYGASLLKQVTSETVMSIGDGTTTASILTLGLVDAGLEMIASGIKPHQVKRQIDNFVKDVVEALTEETFEVKSSDDILNITKISSNNDETIGKYIKEAYDKAGLNAKILVEESTGVETYIDKYDGMVLNKGLMSPMFINSSKQECVLSDVRVLLYDGTLQNLNPLVNIFEKMSAVNENRIVVIADHFEGPAIENMAINFNRKGFYMTCVRTPEFGDIRKEILRDIAAFTGGTVYDRESLESSDLTGVTKIDKIVIGLDNTTITNTKLGPAYNERINTLEDLVNNTSEVNKKEIFKKRLANLSTGIATIYVGGNSEVEMKERKDRVDDAVAAASAAVEEGYVLGAGKALRNIHTKMQTLGKSYNESLMKVLTIPEYVLLQNADITNSEKKKLILHAKNTTHVTDVDAEQFLGVNVFSGQVVNLLNEGIIDPKKATRVALQSAASVAGVVLLTEVLLIK